MSVKVKLKSESVSEVLLSFVVNENPKNKEIKFSHPKNFNTSEITNKAVELLLKDYKKSDKVIIHEARLRLTMF